MLLRFPRQRPKLQISTVLCKPYITLEIMKKMCNFLASCLRFVDPSAKKTVWRWANLVVPENGCMETSIGENNKFTSQEIEDMKKKCFDYFDLGEYFDLKIIE
jgi:hypothetical protein